MYDSLRLVAGLHVMAVVAIGVFLSFRRLPGARLSLACIWDYISKSPLKLHAVEEANDEGEIMEDGTSCLHIVSVHTR